MTRIPNNSDKWVVRPANAYVENIDMSFEHDYNSKIARQISR